MSQRDSLEDRLAKRRRLRNKRFLDKHSVDESEVKRINHSPTTQSLDRKSSQRIIHPNFSNEQRKSSSIIRKNSELPPIDNTNSKQNSILSENKTNSTPLLPQVTKYQSVEKENEKQASSKSLSKNEQQSQQKYLSQDEKPLIIKQTEKSNPIQQESDEKPVIMKERITPILPVKSNPIQQESNEKPMIMKETITPILPVKSNPIQQESDEKPMIMKETITPILPVKSKPILREFREDSFSKQIKHLSSSPDLEYPLTHPQSNIDNQQKIFNFPPFHSKPIERILSEQIVPITKRKYHSNESIFAKQNSLALAYLFNKRMINIELSHSTSSGDEQIKQKTVWD